MIGPRRATLVCIPAIFVAKLYNPLLLVSGIAVIYRTVAIVALGVLTYSIVESAATPRLGGRIIGGLLLLVLWSGISLNWAISPELAFRTFPDIVLSVALAVTVAAAAQSLKTEDLSTIFVWLAVGLLVSTVVMVIAFGGLRVAPLRATPIVFGLYSAVALPIIYSRSIRVKSKHHAAAYAVLFAVIVGVMVLSGTRSAFLAAAIAFAVWGVVVFPRLTALRHRTLQTAGAGLVLGGLAAVVAGFTPGGRRLIFRGFDVFVGLVTGGTLNNVRSEIWAAGVGVLETEWMIGVGLSGFRMLNEFGLSAHNIVLDAWLIGGVVFAALFVLLILWAGSRLYYVVGVAPTEGAVVELGAVFAAYVGCVVFLMFNGSVANSSLFYMFLGVGYAVVPMTDSDTDATVLQNATRASTTFKHLRLATQWIQKSIPSQKLHSAWKNSRTRLVLSDTP